MAYSDPCENEDYMVLRLSKHHSTGNDFLVALTNDPPPDPVAVAVALCHRRRGIGADGLVLGLRGSPGEPVRMRLWNSDGSEAEISGNGLRCLAQALARSRRSRHLEIDIDTPAGLRHCTIRVDSDLSTATGTIDMGTVVVGTIGPGPTPGCDELVTTIDTVTGFTGRWDTGLIGNPHVVIEVADPEAVELAAVGPAVEAHFPAGANVHFGSRTGCDKVKVSIWERGAGVTSACGSGAAVVAAIYNSWGDVGDEVTVEMPGGEAVVQVGPPTTLTGPVVHVADIEIPDG